MTSARRLRYDKTIVSFSALRGLEADIGTLARIASNMEVCEMLMQRSQQVELNVSEALRTMSVAAGVLGLLTILMATLAYIPTDPEFSLFSTFLSDIGDTPGWPQVLFNSGMLIAAPLRYLVLVLFVLRMWQLGAGRRFGVVVLVIGFISTFGTVAMTAVPFSTAPAAHKSGIGMYFLGVVILQTIIFLKEWSMKDLPRILPLTSISLVVIFLTFFAMFLLYESGSIDRTMAVFAEWLCALTSLAWVFAHGVVLGSKQ